MDRSFFVLSCRRENLPTASAAAAISAAATAATAIASTAAATSSAFFAGAGFVDDHITAVIFLPVELGDRVVSRVLARHLNEAEAA